MTRYSHTLVKFILLSHQVGWSEERFVDIITKLRLFLKQAGFRVSDIYTYYIHIVHDSTV